MSEDAKKAASKRDAQAAAQQKRKTTMLAAYVKHGTVFHASKAANVPRRTHYDWLKADPVYADAFKDAADAVADRLEKEAMRRASQGWLEPVYHRGQVVGHVRKFSDLLLIFMLKALRPEKYRERFDHQHAGRFTLEQVLGASREDVNG